MQHKAFILYHSPKPSFFCNPSQFVIQENIKMSTSNPGKSMLMTPSRSPIPQLVKLIERLVREGKLDDVQKLLMSIEKKMRLGIGSVKREPEDIYLEEKLHKSEKEREDLKAKNAKLVEQMKELVGRINENDKIVWEMKSKASENDKTLEVYQEKIKFFDLKVTQLNMELFRLWESRSEATEINEQMRSKLSETLEKEERLTRKLIESGQVIKEMSRATKLATERMKRKLPETGQSVEELKRQNIQAFQIVEKLSRQNLEINVAVKKLRREKLEADEVIEVHRKWFQNLAPIIKNVGEDLGIFSNDQVRNQAHDHIGNSKELSGARGSGGDIGHRL